MKKLFKIIIVLAVLAAVCFGVKSFLLDKGPKSQVATLVSSAVTQTTIATTISATGSLEPVDQVEVGTQVSGDISKIFVDFNSKVKKGQIIAQLDKSKLQATLDQSEIAYQSAQNDYNFKKSTYERTKKLAENNSASAVDLESAEYNMNAAKFTVEQRKNEVSQARLNLSYATIKSPIDGVILERSVDVGQTVAASMSTPTLFIIAKDLNQMKVMADVDEADIGQVKAGQPVEFTVDAFQNETFTGKVLEVRLNPTVTSNVVTYSVVITADNPEQKLLPGMTATCTIITQEVKDAIAVPAAALKFSPNESTPLMEPPQGPPSGNPPEGRKPPEGMSPPEGMPPPDGMAEGPSGKESMNKGDKSGTENFKKGKHVWVNVNGKARPQPVEVGLSDGVNVQILKGLSVGDSVVTGQTTESAIQKEKSENRSPFVPGPREKKRK